MLVHALPNRPALPPVGWASRVRSHAARERIPATRSRSVLECAGPPALWTAMARWGERKRQGPAHSRTRCAVVRVVRRHGGSCTAPLHQIINVAAHTAEAQFSTIANTETSKPSTTAMKRTSQASGSPCCSPVAARCHRRLLALSRLLSLSRQRWPPSSASAGLPTRMTGLIPQAV